MILFNFSVKVSIEDILRGFIEETAVEVINFIIDKGIISGKQSINDIYTFFSDDAKD